MKYRPEIDGLRAIAVIPVILFHAGFELFSGGFVGVDVFFVISGYLITTILIEDIESKRFSIVNFYERRARRILPALFFVMLVCVPFAWIWMLPSQLEGFSASMGSVSIFLSNLYFLSQVDYFAPSAELQPLLHTWSLAVEEQFYLFIPPLLFLTFKLGRSSSFFVITFLLILSFSFSEWAGRENAERNFFFSLSRFWELFAGSIVAFIVQKRGVVDNNAMSLFGLAAILFAIFAYDKNTPFPSYYALAPVLGTASLILYAEKKTLVAQFLSSSVLVGIGLISFSAYLWHQPIFAFARIRLNHEPSLELMGLLSLLSMILAVLSWRYIEKPFRKKGVGHFGRKFIFTISSISILSFLIIGYIGYENRGFPNRFKISQSVYDSMRQTDMKDECFGNDKIHSQEDWFCLFGSSNSSPTIFTFGDSHALSFLPAIDAAASELDIKGIFVGASGCTPFLGIHALRSDQFQFNCHELNKRVFNYVKENKIKTVFLVARWSYYTDGGYSGKDLSYISFEKHGERNKDISRAAFKYGLQHTINNYEEIGVKLIVIPQVPQQKSEPLDIYTSQSLTAWHELSDLSVSLTHHQELQSYVNNLFNNSDIDMLDFTHLLCNTDNCPVGTGQLSFYYDQDHLSLVGAELLVDTTIDFLENLAK